jgi:2-methylcitrate dehydratase PrpD
VRNELNLAPPNGEKGMFSLYYHVANAIMRERSTVSEFTEEAVRDPKVLDMCKKIYLEIKPEYARPGTFRHSRLEIVTPRGTFAEENEFQHGHPKNPIDWEGHVEKMWGYWNSNAMVAKPISRENLEKMVDMLKDLEKVDDVTKIIELMVG